MSCTPPSKRKPDGLVARAKSLLELLRSPAGAVAPPGLAVSKVEDRDAYYRRTARSRFPGKRALLLEDNEACGEILSSLLRRWKMEVTLAPTCRDAMRVLARESASFDFAVLDHSLPDGTGDQVARSLRALGRSKVGACISLSGNRYLPDLSLYDAAIAKPITPEGLRETLVDLLLETASADPSLS